MADIKSQDHKYANSYSIDHMRLRLDKIEQRISALEERRSLANRLVPECELISSGPPKVYQLPIHSSNPGSNGSFKKVVVGRFNEFTHKPKRTILMFGATGSGKSALVDAIANFILGVKWKTNFRFKIILEGELEKSNCFARKITAYTLYNTILPFSLTIIDFPCFSNISDIRNNAKMINKFFSHGNMKLDDIHGIFLVTPAFLPKLSPLQQYGFDDVLSTFGTNMTSNVFLITTFADAGIPPVLEGLKAAKISYSQNFKINTCAVFAGNNSDMNAMLWEVLMKGIKTIFQVISATVPQSMGVTRDLLNEKEVLEGLFPLLAIEVKKGLLNLEDYLKEETALETHVTDLNCCKGFTYNVEVTKVRRVDGINTLYCSRCDFGCVEHCGFFGSILAILARDSNGYCTKCPGRCHSTVHAVRPYALEYYTEQEERTCFSKKNEYEKALIEQSKCQERIAAQKAILTKLQTKIYGFQNDIKSCMKQLNDRALRLNPLFNCEIFEVIQSVQSTDSEDHILELKRIRKLVKLCEKIPEPEGSIKSWWMLIRNLEDLVIFDV